MVQKFETQIKFMTSVMGVVIPLVTIPQVWEIWSNRSAENVSLLTWSFYLFSTIIWLLYGLLKKDKRIISLNIALVILNSLVVLGLIVFR